MFQDLRYGARMLLMNPGFTLIAVLTLALGVGAVAAIFSVADAVLWRPLPAHRPERLVALYTSGGDGAGYRSLSYADYGFYRDNQKSFDGIAAYVRVPLNWRDGDRVERIGSELVTGNFFAVLGLRAAAGRLFTVEDDLTPGGHPVAVISHRLWQRRFKADPGVVGQRMNLNNNEYTIIGVAPAGYSSVLLDWGKQPEVWLPMMMQPQALPTSGNIDLLRNRDALWLMAVGRLKDGIDFAQAEAEVRTLAAQLEAAWPLSNETTARKYWPDEDPVGKSFTLNFSSWFPKAEIIGVVSDIKTDGLNMPPYPEIYRPDSQLPSDDCQLIIRTKAAPETLAAAVREEMGRIDRDIPLRSVRTMEVVIAGTLWRARLSAWLLGLFAALAAALAAAGLYGVMSYSVNKRTQEIGLRMALGAASLDVLRMVIGEGLRLTAIGLALGLTVAFAISRLIASQLFGVTATDPLTYGGVALLLAMVSMAACYIPARRASRVDPMVALREE